MKNDRKVKHASKTVRKTWNKHENSNHKRKQHRQKRWQVLNKPFRCANCRQMIFPSDGIGTVHRNHCPSCLWSLHVDTKPGNRASDCQGRMEPIGLTFKHNGFDKYGRPRSGDVMIVHSCKCCSEININRIAGDDCTDGIFALLDKQETLPPHTKALISKAGVSLISDQELPQLRTAIFGKSNMEGVF
ncbi:MAG TPA: hypothetical protein DCS30_10370 [Rhizobiales bacterium]|nr:hypothetical protein [Hyphomicrobiales bacterium]